MSSPMPGNETMETSRPVEDQTTEDSSTSDQHNPANPMKRTKITHTHPHRSIGSPIAVMKRLSNTRQGQIAGSSQVKPITPLQAAQHGSKMDMIDNYLNGSEQQQPPNKYVLAHSMGNLMASQPRKTELPTVMEASGTLEDPESWLSRHRGDLDSAPQLPTNDMQFSPYGQPRETHSYQDWPIQAASLFGQQEHCPSMDSGYSSVGFADDISSANEPWHIPDPAYFDIDESEHPLLGLGHMMGPNADHFFLETTQLSPGFNLCQDMNNGGGKASGSSSFQIVSPQTQESSNDGLSSRPTETSTPESNSFWLPEYSEDEQESLGNDHPFMRFKALAVVAVVKSFLSWKENPSDQDEPCDGASAANDAPNQDKGKGKDAPTRKRASADRSETGKGTTDGSEPSSSQAPSIKRRRTSDRKLTFACPYTKKNPMSYKDCYKYTLSRIRDVKQHLARRHQNPLYCPRCMNTFENEAERDTHIREFACSLRPSITFDGITESQKHQLAKKSASNTSEEAQWFAVFDILFPGHDPRPESPYIDRELLQDITLYQDFLTSNGPRILSEVLTGRGAVTWNLSNEERDLAAFQQTVLEEGLREIFNQWVARGGSSSTEHLEVPPNAGIASNLTPPSSDTSVERAGPGSNQAPRIPPTGPGRQPTHTRAGRDAQPELEGAPSSHNPFAEGLNAIMRDNLLGGLDFYDGPDDELMGWMSDPLARSSFPPAPG